jgi:hypothetical protein
MYTAGFRSISPAGYESNRIYYLEPALIVKRLTIGQPFPNERQTCNHRGYRQSARPMMPGSACTPPAIC